MAYTNFNPETRVQESQDAKSFKIWDQSNWNGESGNTTICYIRLFFIENGVTTTYDDYHLIVGADKTKYNEYLDRDGHIVNIADLTIDGSAAAERFEDGYYIVRTYYSDGTYAEGTLPYYDNSQAFLAKNRCMKRKMPAKLLSWPITDEVAKKNRDIFLQGLYLESAENAADLNKLDQFQDFMASIRAMFNYYEIENCW
jgi:hypothetical protein